MKKSMPEYIAIMSECDFTILEEIFEDKFNKFRKVYWLIRDYSDYITSLKYKKTKRENLKIEFTVAKLDIGKIVNQINSKIEDDSNILVTTEGKIIKIKICSDESVSK